MGWSVPRSRQRGRVELVLNKEGTRDTAHATFGQRPQLVEFEVGSTQSGTGCGGDVRIGEHLVQLALSLRLLDDRVDQSEHDIQAIGVSDQREERISSAGGENWAWHSGAPFFGAEFLGLPHDDAVQTVSIATVSETHIASGAANCSRDLRSWARGKTGRRNRARAAVRAPC